LIAIFSARKYYSHPYSLASVAGKEKRQPISPSFFLGYKHRLYLRACATVGLAFSGVATLAGVRWMEESSSEQVESARLPVPFILLFFLVVLDRETGSDGPVFSATYFSGVLYVWN